ncbi:MAG TPA: ABC transporter ATP-binding protein [Oscillospiraceae bacterium]|nr:ABC transporter ATP-binding protein [Oscillospiraceae bacterium]
MIKLARFLKPLKWFAFLTILFSLAHSGLSLLLPKMLASIINEGIAKDRRGYILFMGSIMLFLAAFSAGASILSNYFSARTSTGYGKTLRREVFFKIESLSLCDIDFIGTPSLITRNTNDINKIQDMLMTILRTLITAPIMMIGGAVMAFSMNKELSSLMFIVIPFVIGIAFLVAKVVIPMFEKVQKKTDSLNQILREKLSGIRVIRAFDRSEYENARFREANLDLTALSLRISRIMSGLMPLSVLLIFLLTVAIIGVSSKQINALDANIEAQRMEIASTVGNLQAFLVYLAMMIGAVAMAAEMFIMLPRAKISADRINEVLEIESKIVEPKNPAIPSDSHQSILEFRDVYFSYPGATASVLSAISFTAKAGQTTAIIGGTGSGKSSLVNLIPRYFDISYGSILLNGIDIRYMSTKVLREKIGFIPQKAFLFSGTIADNLMFGKPNASEEDMWRALEVAQAAEFVKKLPDGLQTRVSQGGKNFSGGQQQRLAIARALIRRSSFYIFDDSFSALDFITDAKLRAALKDDLKDSALIIVAQRVGTILDADQIIVLDEGRVAGIGKHKDLLENCDVYREIALSQLSAEDLAI